MNATRPITRLIGAVLVVAACASAPAPTTVPASSTAGQPSNAAATTSAKPSFAQAPSATPAVAARCDNTAKPFDANDVELTGPWAGDDGGIYYLRQLGSVLWWNGMSGRAGGPSLLGRDWNNVARGDMKALVIDVEWADVPRGGVLGNGTMQLKVEGDATGNVRIVKVSETGSGFGNNIWTPCSPG